MRHCNGAYTPRGTSVNGVESWMPSPLRLRHGIASLGLLALLLAAGEAGAQSEAPRPGGDRSLRQWSDSFPAVLYAEDALRATAYALTSAGETLDIDLRRQTIERLPDSMRPSGDVPVGVMVVREWQQVGTQTPRLIRMRLRHAPEAQFRPFQAALSIETAEAPDGRLRLTVDGVLVGEYSNRARYAVASTLISMRKPWAAMTLSVDDRVLWEGRFVSVPERRSRLRFVDGRAEIVSP